MDLSLCMIVKNEEVSLPRCLSSVQGVVDQLVVLDTGSQDRTPEIAREFGAEVYEFEWCNNFSIARNESLKYAKGDWILVLDADEVLVPAIAPLIRQTIQTETCLLINLIRQEIGAEQSPYSLISRLFRRHPEIHFTRPYHAMVDDSVTQILQREPHWQILDLPQVAILHDGYQPGAIAGRDKATKARLAMEGFLAENPTDAYVRSKLGALYVQSGEITQGIELLKQGVELPADPPVTYELHYHLGIAYSRLQQLEQAETHYQIALQQPILPSLKLGAYINYGNLLGERAQFAQAADLYRTVLEIDPTFAMAHYNLGLMLKAMSRLAEAIAAYQTALHYKPDYAEAYQNLGVALLKQGRVPESLTAFGQAIALYDQRQSPEGLRLRQGLQEMGFRVL